MQDQLHQCVCKFLCERRVALHQTKRDGAAERVDHEIDVGSNGDLAAIDRAP